MLYDVAVVGAGPAGSRVAALLAGKGRCVVLLEEHAEVGEPVHCTGLVSIRTLEMLGGAERLSTIRGVRAFPPGAEPLEIISREPKAAVIDRAACDKALAAEAIRAGAELRLGSKVERVEMLADRAKIMFSKGGGLDARLVVGADGLNSAVRRALGIAQPSEALPAVSADIPLPEGFARDVVDLYLGEGVAPGFFAWAVPAGEKLRVGLAARAGNPHVKLLMALLRERFNVTQTLGIRGGTIPVGMTRAMHGERALLVGDAAGQVKPLSGGGLYLGLTCAGLCAGAAERALQTSDEGGKGAARAFSAKSLSGYTHAVKSEIGKEVSRGLRMRRVFTSLSDAELRDAVALLRPAAVVDAIARLGDIDFPSALAKPVLSRAPKLVKFSPRLLKALL